jgi:hypothetical protein
MGTDILPSLRQGVGKLGKEEFSSQSIRHPRFNSDTHYENSRGILPRSKADVRQDA